MKQYGILNFLFDIFMIWMTGWLWIAWIVLRFFAKAK